MSTPWVWKFPAKLVRVIDGDTVVVEIDKGFEDWGRREIRVANVNTPELHAKDATTRDAAQAAKKFTEKQLTTWSSTSTETYPLEIRTTKKDSFGRWIGHIMPVGTTLPELDLSAALVASGNAVPFMVEA